MISLKRRSTPSGTSYATLWAWMPAEDRGEMTLTEFRFEREATVDTTGPTATLVTETIELGRGTPTFSVLYWDETPAPREGSLPIRFTNRPELIVTGPNGFSASPQAPGVVPGDSLNEIRIAYAFIAPAISLEPGVYTVTLRDNTVSDLLGNFAPGEVLGAFTVVDARV